jgi:hypothetical protein
MSICILFILFNGSGYLTPACYDGYELITPHNVAFVQHIPSEYEYNLYESPDYYLDYYWNAREEYCRSRRSWGQSWGQGWAFWTPHTNRAKNQALCGDPHYLQYVHYYSVPYRVRNNVKRRLKTKRHYHYKNSYKKHRGHKKYKKYGKRKNHHTNYKKHYKKHHETSYKKHKRPQRRFKNNARNQRRPKNNVRRQTRPNRRQHHANRPKRKSRKR